MCVSVSVPPPPPGFILFYTSCVPLLAITPAESSVTRGLGGGPALCAAGAPRCPSPLHWSHLRFVGLFSLPFLGGVVVQPAALALRLARPGCRPHRAVPARRVPCAGHHGSASALWAPAEGLGPRDTQRGVHTSACWESWGRCSVDMSSFNVRRSRFIFLVLFILVFYIFFTAGTGYEMRWILIPLLVIKILWLPSFYNRWYHCHFCVWLDVSSFVVFTSVANATLTKELWVSSADIAFHNGPVFTRTILEYHMGFSRNSLRSEANTLIRIKEKLKAFNWGMRPHLLEAELAVGGHTQAACLRRGVPLAPVTDRKQHRNLSVLLTRTF